MRTRIGQVPAKSNTMYNVYWDSKNQEVWVEKPTIFGKGTFSKCSVKAETAQDAMHVASAFLHDR